MASVSLGDLMNPLKKIEEYSQKTEESMSVVVQVATTGLSIQAEILQELRLQSMYSMNLATTGLSIQAEILQELRLQSMYFMDLLGQNGAISSALNMSGGGVATSKAGISLKDLGLGTKDMAKALLLFSLVPKKTVNKFLDFMEQLGEKLNNFDEKKTTEGTDALMAIGDGIWSFVKKLALSALLIIPVILFMPVILLTVALFTSLFALIGRFEKPIDKGGEALRSIGLGLVLFGAGLLIFTLASMVILKNPVTLLVMVGTILLIGGAVALLGMFGDKVEEGAMTLILMGIGLIAFSLGFGLFALVASQLEISDVLIMSLVIVGVGLAMAIVGIVATSAIMGAIALGVAGIALIALAAGVFLFNLATQNMTMDDGIKMAAVLVGVGLAFAAVGLVSVGIYLAAPALIMAGIALISLSVGLLIFNLAVKQLDLEKDGPKMAIVLVGIGLAFAAVGLVSIGIYLAAPALILAGVALTLLGVGLMLFSVGYEVANKAGLWDDTGDKGIFGGKILKFEAVLDSIAAGLSINPFTVAGILLGAPALLLGGIALTVLSLGLVLFGKAYDSAKGNGLFDDTGETGFFGGKILKFEQLLDNIAAGLSINPLTAAGMLLGAPALILGSVALLTMSKGIKAFGSMYEETGVQKLFEKHPTFIVESFFSADRPGSHFEFLMAGIADAFDIPTLQVTKMYASAPALIKAGNAMILIAKGIKGFSDVIKQVEGGDLSAITANITAVITTVSQAFGAIGGKKTGGLGSRLGSFFGFGGDIPGAVGPNGEEMYSPDAVKRGIESVSGMGEILVSVAEGVLAFAKMEYKDLNGKVVKIDDKIQAAAIDNAGKVISVVAAAFGEIGKMYPVTDDGWFTSGSSDVQKGIQAVNGMGSILVNVAEGVKAFADMSFKDADGNVVKIPDADLQEGGKIMVNISSVLGAVSRVFGFIGASSDGGYFSDPSGTGYTADQVREGVDAVQGIGGILSGVGAAVKAFAEADNPDTKPITDFIIDVVSAITNLGGFDVFTVENNSDLLAKVFDGIAEVAEKADPFEKVAKSMGELKDNINAMDLEKLTLTNDLMHNITLAGESDGTDAALEKISEVFTRLEDFFGLNEQEETEAPSEGGAPVAKGGGGGNADLKATLDKIAGTLSALQSTMEGLPDDIASIKLKVK